MKRYRATIHAAAIALAAVPLLTSSLHSQAAGPRWSLREEMRIGARDGANALSRIGPIAVHPRSGDIYIPQPQAGEIRVFDAAGRDLRRFGQRGPGPGEFRGLGWVGWDSEALVATDIVKAEVSYFTDQGVARETFQVRTEPLVEGLAGSYPAALLADGAFLGRTGLPSGRDSVSIPIVRMDRNGGVLQVLDHLKMVGATATVRVDPNTLVISHPTHPSSFMAAAPDGSAVVFVHQGVPRGQIVETFQVRRFDGQGQLLYDVQVPFSPLPLSPELADSIVRARAEPIADDLLQGQPGITREAFIDAFRQALAFPPFVPPVTEVVAAVDGSTWIRREMVGTPQVRWLVLDSTGQPAATVELPPGVQIHNVNGDVVWGVELDELGVPYAVKYRLVR